MSLRMQRGYFFAVLGIALPMGLAHGQGSETPVPPSQLDPGQLQQEQRRQLERLEEQQRRERRDTEEAVIEIPEAVTPDTEPDLDFTLQGVRFTESELLEDAALAEVAERYVGRDVTFRDIQRLIEDVNRLYRLEGYITAQAFLPPQEIRDGVLTILLVEGRVGQVRIDGNTYVADDYILNRTNVPLGDVLRIDVLQGQLERFNAREDIRLSASLAAGEEFGETDVILRAAEPPRTVYQFFVDNSGNESTGQEQAGVLLSHRGILGSMDRASFYATYAEGARFADLSYAFPVNRHGGVMSLRYSISTTEVVDGPFDDLDLEGKSTTMAVQFDQPWIRTYGFGMDLVARASQVDSEGEILGVDYRDQRIRQYDAGLRWEFLEPGYQVTLQPMVGTMRTEDNILDDKTGVAVFTGTGTWLQRISDNFYSVVMGRWQFADQSQSVPPAGEFQVGGARSVRGYQQGIASGPHGYHVSGEIHWPGARWIDPFVFVDHGHVKQVAESSESITGVGGGFRWQRGRWLSTELTYGHALDNDIIPDQDDYQIHFRITLQGFRP